MYINLTKNPLFYLSLILAVIVGFQTWSLVQAGTFAEPTSAFPTSDVSAPVETGEVAQTKYERLSFAPAASSTDIRVSVGLDGLYLKNDIELPEDIRTLSGFVSNWDMFKNFVRAWSGPDTDGIISYTGGVLIEREEEQVITPAISERDAYCGGTPSTVQCYTEDNPYQCKGYSYYDEYNDEWEIYPVSNYFSCEWNDCCSDSCDSSCSSYNRYSGDCDNCDKQDEYGYYYWCSDYNCYYIHYNGYCYDKWPIPSCYSTVAVPGWTEEQACESRGCTWYPYRAPQPEVTGIVTVPSMEVKSDGNVEIDGSLTTGIPSKIWIGEEDGRISYLCGGKFNMLYGSHEMNCVSLHSWINFTTSKVGSRWSEHINKCVKNMRLYVTGCEHPTEWPCCEDVGSNYEEHESGRGFKVWDVSNNTISVMIWRDSSKDNSAVGCKFVTQILIDGIDGSGGSGWITGYLKADEIWEPATAIFGD